ncbi:MAG: ATP-binding protein [Planctomycetaceae bacterium]|jgi:AAA+ superfamily predicted ATPase|nr:ATP-binding protein [Planctomycetaceae bacterium]
MRSNFVIKLVEAYNQDANTFRDAVEILADDEAKKGNNDIAEKLRLAISHKKGCVNNTAVNNSFIISRASSPIITANLKDKNSSLSLFDTITPSVGFDELFYSPTVSNIFDQIILEWNKSQELLKAGILPSRRILLYGPSGCGKTMAGMALAKSIKMPVAYVRLDGLFSSFLGQTSSNLRRIFESVVKPPQILFLDEFDAVAKKRDDNQEIGEIKRIVISLLQNLDFLPPEVLVIAATNHEHLLDPAIWRRFDISIGIGLPEYETRKRMIETWLNPYKTKTKNVNIDTLAKITDRFNIAQIKNIVLQTIKKNLILNEANAITTNDFLKQIIFLEGYNLSKESLLKFATKLRNSGITIDNIAHITGIPKSTIGDHTSRNKKKVKNEK